MFPGLRKGGPSSLSARLFISATILVVVILFVTGIALSSLYQQAVERSFDRRLNLYLRTLIAEVAPPEDADDKGQPAEAVKHAQELVDTAVNMGPARPSMWFQASLNVLAGARLTVDGRVGPKTIAAYRSLQQQRGKVPACRVMLDALDGAQRRRYEQIAAANPSQRRFLKGWLARRINNVDRKTCGRGE